MISSSTVTDNAVQTIHSSNEELRLGYGASFSADEQAFEASLEAAQTRLEIETESSSELAKAAVKPLDYIDREARSLGDYANTALATDNELTPAEIVNLTVQSHKFMFHSQLTANVANRSADGIQQLFRQQG
jgi:ribosomal protein S12 methylthiotransferase accessory factor YcaO